MGIHGCTRIYKGILGYSRVYMGIQGYTTVYKGMQWVYQGIQWVYRGYSRIYRVFSGHYKCLLEVHTTACVSACANTVSIMNRERLVTGISKARRGLGTNSEFSPRYPAYCGQCLSKRDNISRCIYLHQVLYIYVKI